jgi:D-alanyl-D-alanine carboxypeptidase
MKDNWSSYWNAIYRKSSLMLYDLREQILILVNKQNNLQMDDIPSDLIEPNIPFSFDGSSPKKLMRQEAAKAMEDLVDDAKKDGINLLGQSAYRSYETQKVIYKTNLKHHGETAKQFSAFPGQSEHQTGLAIDITSERMGFKLEQSFGETPEGIWVENHAAEHGFIIRGPFLFSVSAL